MQYTIGLNLRRRWRFRLNDVLALATVAMEVGREGLGVSMRSSALKCVEGSPHHGCRQPAKTLCLENGAVTKPRRGNTKAIARISQHFSAMREMAADAASLESELGLSPRRRSSAAKTERKARTARPSDNYLRPVAK